MTSPVVVATSRLLNELPIHAQPERPENFRSLGSVGRKINSLRAARPDYAGTGLRVIPLEKIVAMDFYEDPARMDREALDILAKYGVKPPL